MTRRVNNMAMAHTRKASKVSSLLVLKNIPSKKHYCSVPEKKKKILSIPIIKQKERFFKDKNKIYLTHFLHVCRPRFKNKKEKKKIMGN